MKIFILQVGDKLISVNGHSLVNADHYTAVEVLRAAGSTLVLEVTREVPVIQPHVKVRNPVSATNTFTINTTIYQHAVGCRSLLSKEKKETKGHFQAKIFENENKNKKQTEARKSWCKVLN